MSTSLGHALLALLALLAASSAFASAPDEATKQERLRRLKQAGYTYENCHLKGIPAGQFWGTPVEGFRPYYSAEQFPYRWDFEDGTLSGINGSSGVEDLRVEDGTLKFTVSAGTGYLNWGDIVPTKTALSWGYASKGGYPTYPMAGVEARIRQSLPKSEWGFNYKAYRRGSGVTQDSKLLEVKGTEWQTVVLLPKTYYWPPYSAFQLFCKTPGNKVEIDWLRPFSNTFGVAARKTLELPAKVRWAKCSLNAKEFYYLYVNGKLAFRSRPGSRSRQLWDHEIDPGLFRVGRNAITMVGGANHGTGTFVLDGALLCADGTYVRFDSDDSWKRPKVVQGAEMKEWTRADFDDTQWLPVRLIHEDQKTDLRSQFYDDLVHGRRLYFNPSWKGQLMVAPADGRGQPVFGSREPVSLRVAVPFRAGEKQEVTYEVFDEMGDGYLAADKLVTKGSLSLKRRGLDNVAVLRLDPGELAANVAYAVAFTLRINDAEAENYRYEIAVCGPVPQPVVKNPKSYTDGMDLGLVWELDAAAAQKPGEFISCGGDSKPRPSKVVTTPLGKFRTTYDEASSKSSGGCDCNYISFRYTIKNPGRPHLALAEYPDDSKRMQEMRLNDGFLWGDSMAIANDSVVLGMNVPLSHTLKQHHVIFFPNDTEGTVTFFAVGDKNAWKPSMAAKVGKIRIYEILNDVPARAVVDAPGPGKWFGQQPEAGPRQIVTSCFASPITPFFKVGCFLVNRSPYFYRNWLVAYTNMVKRLRFAGENCYYSGQYMYAGVLFPSEFSESSAYDYGNSPGTMRDYGVLMSKMFEENDLGWFSSLEICALSRVARTCSDAAIAEGHDTLATVDRNGKQTMFLGRSVYPNWLRPECQAYFKQLMDELITLYGRQRGWRGITLQVNEACGPCWLSLGNPYDTSYDDYTIRLFERETGLKIPVDAKDRKRFTKRYEWLMANAKQKWAVWRAAKMTELYDWLAKRLRNARPDLDLVFYTNSCSFMDPKGDGRPEDQLTVSERALRGGIDWAHMRKQDGVICAHSVYGSRSAHSYLAGKDEVDNFLLKAHDRRFLSEISNDGRSGVTLRRGWYEPQPWAPKDWPWPDTQLMGLAWPYDEGLYLARDWVNVLVRSNPSLILHALQDLHMWNGREFATWRFARAFRSIPVGKYTRLEGAGLDKNLWISVTKRGRRTHGYVANPCWWDVDATLTLGKDNELFDLLAQEHVAGGEWKIKLGPYDVRTFQSAARRPDQVFASASAQVSESGRDQFRKELTDTREKLEQARDAIARAPGLDAKLKQWLGRCEVLVESGDYDEAHEAFILSPLLVKVNQLCWRLEGYTPKLAVASRRTAAIVIDGDLKEWASPFCIEFLPEKMFYQDRPGYNGAQDLSGKAQCQWDEKHLYLAFRVTDDVLDPKIFGKDSVEVYFDMDILGDWGDGQYSADDHNYKLGPVLTTSELELDCRYGEGGRKVLIEDPPLNAKWKKSPDGYWIEAAIPWTMLTDKPVKQGLKFGFDAMLIEKDGPKERVNIMFWSTPKLPFMDPRVFGRMVLGDTQGIAAE